MAHTPGPWSITDERDTYKCEECGGAPRYLIGGPAHSAHDGSSIDYLICELEDSNPACGVDQEANARLIAAAPALLAALKQAVEALECLHECKTPEEIESQFSGGFASDAWCEIEEALALAVPEHQTT